MYGTSASKSARIKGARIACEFGSPEAGMGGQELWGVHRYFGDSFAPKNLNNKTLMSTKSRSKDFSVSLFQLGESLATLAAWAWETQSVNQVHVLVCCLFAFLERPVGNCLAGCVRCSRYCGLDNWEVSCPTS